MSSFIGKNIIRVERVSSTNDYALELLDRQKEKIIDGTVIVADQQTAGKGQQGNTWQSEKGQNLTLSVVLFPTFVPPDEQFSLSKVVSLGITDFLQTYCQDVYIKWPNDIYIKNAKIGGILIEHSILGNMISHTIAGIGLNVNQTFFPQDIPNPTSMKLCKAREFDLKKTLNFLLTFIENRYFQLGLGRQEELNRDYTSRLYWLNEKHEFESFDEQFTGKILGAEDNGELRIQTENGEIQGFYFKEVEFLK
jgi:BirA family transcriptional regulator, biotin operon repressor / biotin---[acetyl-CoA-carboxylase] ligase